VRSAVLFGVLAILSISSAEAQQDITFSGTVAGLCVLTIPIDGSLAIDANGYLSSAPLGFGSVTVLSIGANHLRITRPAWDSYPATYNPGGEDFQLAYQGLSGLSAVTSNGFISSGADIAISSIPLSILQLHARASSPSPWVSSVTPYKMKVTVTCSAT
jgi:hypothetical protein